MNVYMSNTFHISEFDGDMNRIVSLTQISVAYSLDPL